MDTGCKLYLHLTFFSLLQSPIEKLSVTCQKTSESELDKVVIAVNHTHTDFVMDVSSLQALQPLIQWVTDLCLYLLAALPSVHPPLNSANIPNGLSSNSKQRVLCLLTQHSLSLLMSLWSTAIWWLSSQCYCI